MEQNPDLEELREQIDAVDREIVRLFEERMAISEKIADVKERAGKDIFDRKREEQKIAAVRELAHDESSRNDIGELYSLLMAMSRRRQHAVLEQVKTDS